MSISIKKDQIIACKVSQEEKKVLEKMASKERRSVNNFIITSALNRRNELLGDSR